uniref:Uncharacterized protein n=1 Tax=Acrobeloides nanus TaxID=290746 RepID=A0A914CIA5_9BILA
MYLNSTGLLGCLSSLDELAIISNTIQAWLLFEMSISTIRNGGLQIKRVFTINDKYFETNEDSMLSLYLTDPNLKNKDYIARTSTDFYQDYFQTTQAIHTYRFDESELTVLMQLWLISIKHIVSKRSFWSATSMFLVVLAPPLANFYAVFLKL